MREVVYNFYSCNIWKEYGSMRLIGIAADKETLYRMMGSKIKDGDILYKSDDDKESWKRFLADYCTGEVDFDQMVYGHVDEQTVYSTEMDNLKEDFPNLSSVRRSMATALRRCVA